MPHRNSEEDFRRQTARRAAARALPLVVALATCLPAAVQAQASAPAMQLARYAGQGSIDVDVFLVGPTLAVDLLFIADLGAPAIRTFDLTGDFEGRPVTFVATEFLDVVATPGAGRAVTLSFGASFFGSIPLDPPLGVTSQEPVLFEARIDGAGNATVEMVGPPVQLLIGDQTFPAGSVSGGVGMLEERCRTSETELCLIDGRFKVEIDWLDQRGRTGVGHPLFAAERSGLFWFFADDNWELLVKMIDACSSSFHSYWVFSAATTNVEYTLTVTDTDSDAVAEYFNALGVSAAAVNDTAAFATCP